MKSLIQPSSFQMTMYYGREERFFASELVLMPDVNR